jgi:hypothetical protein
VLFVKRSKVRNTPDKHTSLAVRYVFKRKYQYSSLLILSLTQKPKLEIIQYVEGDIITFRQRY